MIFISSCSCFCLIYWSKVLSKLWRCCWSSADRRCSNYIWMMNNYVAYSGVAYFRGLMVPLYQLVCIIRMGEHPWFNINISSYQQRKSHCGDKTVITLSYLHTGISFIGKMVSLYGICPQISIVLKSQYLWTPFDWLTDGPAVISTQTVLLLLVVSG